MKNQIKNIYRFSMLVLLLGVAGMTKMFAYDFSAVCETGQTLYYNITDDTNHYVELTPPSSSNPYWEGFTQPTGNITLPNSVIHNGTIYSVTTIGDHAFDDCVGLTGSLTIPNSVTTIGGWAFSGCYGFTGNLTIGSSVTEIGDCAFQCSGFTGDLVIPDSVTTIGNSAFVYCRGFTGNLIIGNSVTSIGEGAFYGCSGLTGSLIIPNSVTTIEGGVFEGCSSLASITIPNSVTSIGMSAFRGCTSLSSVTIPNSVTEIDVSNPFSECSGLEQIIVDASNPIFDSRENCNAIIETGSNTLVTGCQNTIILNSVTSIRSGAFMGCSGLTGSLTIPNSVTSIGSEAFMGCSGLTGSLTIPNSVTEIGGYAFCNCTGFNGTLTLGNSLETIGGYAFTTYDPNFGYIVGWPSLNFIGDLVIPNSVTTIGEFAFASCGRFTGSLTIGNSVEEIGSAAFSGCLFTGDLIIPNSVTTIGYGAFAGCNRFTGSLTIGNSVTTIGQGAFQNCSGFSGDLVIPNSVIILGENEVVAELHGYGGGAFEGCSGFSGSLIIGNSVTTIISRAFWGCNGFTEIHSKNTIPPFLDSDVFGNEFQTIFVPCDATEAYASASEWSLYFYHYEEEFFDLTVMANEDSLGRASILSLGNCENPECTVLAEPYPGTGSMFINWTMNEVEVSSDPEYTFVASEGLDLIANFESVGNADAFVFVGGSTTNHWNDPDNWIPNELPTDTSLVNIFSSVEVNVDACVSSMTIFDSNSVTINPDVTLTVTETLSSPTTTSIVVEEGGQLVHANDGVLATVKRSIMPYTDGERDGWYLIASPLADDVGASEIENLTANEYDLYYYDEPTHYWMNQENVNNDFNAIEKGRGYLYGNNCIVPSFEAQVGNGISTISYFPFYTLYDNSITESLFLAEELGNAGVTIDPMTSLSWYATNQTGYLQSNISIWMANVNESVLTTTSHNTSGMTLVYTGAMTPEIGWNEFVFNEGNFAWDGVSNILICVQRNNGAWNSTVQWQSHNCGFVGMTYACRDHSGSNPNSYDMENETYTMHTSTSRANTIFKKLGYDDNSITISFIGELENGASMVDIPLSYTETAGSLKGFNLVGNPFAHNVTSYAETNVAEGCFRMNEAKDNLIVSEVSETQPLKPTEGFFVKATAEGASITFNARSKGETARKGFINLELSKDGKLIDRLIVKKDGEPLEKLTLKENGTRIFAMQGHQEIAIVPCAGNEQAVNFKAAKDSNYAITMNAESMELNYLHLIDNLTGNDVDLMVTPTYTFEAKTTDYASRFRLVFSVCEDADDDNVESFAFVSNSTIIVTGDYIDAMLQIVDMFGHVIVSTDVVHNVSTDGIASGVYVLRLINGDIVKTQKIVIR